MYVFLQRRTAAHSGTQRPIDSIMFRCFDGFSIFECLFDISVIFAISMIFDFSIVFSISLRFIDFR